MLIINDLYFQMFNSASESDYLQRKAYYLQKYDTHFEGCLRLLWGYQCNPEGNFVHFEASSSYVIFKNSIENC